jgi:hypothetical protein
MTQENSKQANPNHETQSEEMARYGISCVPADNFYYREFHYTNLKDAVAQATRDKVRLGLFPTA